MKKNLFTIIIFLILIGFALYAPITSYLEEKEIINNKSMGIVVTKPEPAKGVFAPFINLINSIKYETEMAYQNYMPLYLETVGAYKDFMRNLNSSVYTLYDNKATATNEKPQFPDNTLPNQETQEPKNPDADADKIQSFITKYIGAPSRDRYYSIELTLTDGTKIKFLEAISKLTDEQKDIRVKSQISSVNRIIQANSNVNVCVYAAVNMEFSDFLEKYIPDEKSSKPYLEQFISGIDKSAQTGYIKFDGVLDRVERCYLSDHHWSAAGSYAGYCEIINLMREKSPAILPPRDCTAEILIDNCKFYGSYARTSILDEYWDSFIVRDYSLPTHYSTPEYNFYKQIDYLKSKNINSFNSNAYGEFFPELHSITYPQNNTGRNLIIIGDSYAQGFIELISSSFDNTFCFYWSTYKNLNYNKFIAENNITDVLIMQFGTRLIFNATDDYYLDRINIDPYVTEAQVNN